MEIPTPKELNDRREVAESGAFWQVIRAMTETLYREYVEKDGPVDTEISASLANERVQQRVISAFAKKGWTVNFGKLVFDQREGSRYPVRIESNSNPTN